MQGGCGEGARRVQGGGREGARRVQGGCKEGARRVQGGCEEGVSMGRKESGSGQVPLEDIKKKRLKKTSTDLTRSGPKARRIRIRITLDHFGSTLGQVLVYENHLSKIFHFSNGS